MRHNRLAVVFDFDDTLADDSTSALLRSFGLDAEAFWTREVAGRVKDGWDPTLAWLQRLVELAQPGQPLEGLCARRMTEFGATLELYEGLPDLFDELREICHRFASDPPISFYVISGGLEAVLAGSPVAPHVDGIRACCLHEQGERIVAVKSIVDFTIKTRCLYEINKGVFDRARTLPYAVNEDVPQDRRPIPFANMIYVGDGLTDVPCFSLLHANGGKGFGVFDPTNRHSVRQAFKQLASPRRVASVLAPRYGPEDALGAMLRIGVEEICRRIDLVEK